MEAPFEKGYSYLWHFLKKCYHWYATFSRRINVQRNMAVKFIFKKKVLKILNDFDSVNFKGFP